jgi:hypothetical protein
MVATEFLNSVVEMHHWPRRLCWKVLMFQWEKWATLNFVITVHLIVMTQGTLVFYALQILRMCIAAAIRMRLKDVRWHGRLFSAILIPQSLQLRAQVTLARQGWCHVWGECAKSGAQRSVCFFSKSGGGASICVDYSSNHVTEVGRLSGLWTDSESCHGKWRGLCGYNPVVITQLDVKSLQSYWGPCN